MKVNEIFYSIQAEGISIGVPSIFIRLAGCNLKCDFCDSKYAYEGKEMFYEQVIEEIKKYPCKRIIWTGGEPTLQIIDIINIIKLLGNEYKHEIETNGTNEITPEFFDVITISPKKESLKSIKYYILEKSHIVKIVVENEENLKFWKEWIDNICRSEEKNYINKFCLMPQGQTKEEIEKNSIWLVEECKKLNMKFCPRLQIMIWDKKRGV